MSTHSWAWAFKPTSRVAPSRRKMSGSAYGRLYDVRSVLSSDPNSSPRAHNSPLYNKSFTEDRSEARSNRRTSVRPTGLYRSMTLLLDIGGTPPPPPGRAVQILDSSTREMRNSNFFFKRSCKTKYIVVEMFSPGKKIFQIIFF